MRRRLLYAAQAIPMIDTARAEKNPFRTETKDDTLTESIIKGFIMVRSITFLLYLALLLIPFITEAAPQQIKVVMDDNYPPFVFKGSNGELQGITIDQWRLWEKKTGIKAEITATDWGVAQKRMAAGEFDVIDTIFKNPKREQLYAFTKPYSKLPVPLFVHKDISGIGKVEDAKGFAVAAKQGGAVIDFLKKSGVENIVEYPSYEKIVQEAKAGKVKIFTEERQPGLYFLNKYGLTSEFHETVPMYSGEFHRAVKKNNREILQIVGSGFDSISEAEYREIDKKWLGSPLPVGSYLRYAGYVVVGLGGVILLMAVFLRVLKKKVDDRTSELSKEISARKEKERALKSAKEYHQALFNLVNDAIFVHDAESGSIIDVNQRVCQMYGFDRSEIIGGSVGEISSNVSPYTAENALVKIMKAKEEGRQTFLWECRRKNGEIFPTEVSLCYENVEGSGKVLASVRDISDRLKMQKEMERVERLESLGLLAGGIAHDFNNILTGVIANVSYSRMLISEEHKAAKRLEDAEKAAMRATGLTRQLLTFAKGGEPVRKPVDISKMIQEMLTAAVEGTNVSGGYKHADDLWFVDGDEGQLSQCIDNLLINAIQAMPDGGKIEIEAENVEMSGKRWVSISVSDNGRGIPEELQSRVFDPYFTTKKTGTGLGLASLHSIITRHGGSINLTSKQGEGTTFRLILPAADRLPEIEEKQPAEARTDSMKSLKVLVMDDEEMIRNIAKEMLEQLGCRADLAEEGKQAVEMYRKAFLDDAPYNLVILDLTVPGGIGGIEAASLIHQIDKNATLIVSSGYSNDPVIANFAEYGFCGAIMKPYNMEIFSSKLSRIREQKL